jgi:tRNA A-37 threonylcarbamoyl transferase component Bud32
VDDAKPHENLLPERFELERQLGAGAIATTYLARDRVLDRTVVIKAVRRDVLWDFAARSRFEREARAAAAVNHPNVVGVYDFGEYKGTLFLVLRDVEGISLRSYLAQRGRLSADEAVRICGQLLAGLGAIHNAGLIHRDLKPENVIVGRDGLLRITDFGIAVAQSDIRLTTHGEIWGTPAYMAPEQVLGEPVSPATDLYAVGVMLFEMLTGRLPFPSNGDAVVAAYAHVSKPLPALWEVEPNIDAPPELEAVMRRALAKESSARYETAIGMASDLQGAVARATEPAMVAAGVSHQPVRTAAPVYAPSAPAAVASRSVPVASFLSLRPRGLAALIPLLAATLLIAVFGAGGALGFWQNGDATPTATAAAQATETVTPPEKTEAVLAAERTPTAPPAVQPTRVSETMAQATSTATKRATSTPTATKRATATPTATEPPPTATNSPPTATKKPATHKARRTATPKPKPTVQASQPTIAADVPVSANFTVSDWRGGFAGDQSWYGRPWLAVYGAWSAYPQASINFNLDAAPSGPEVLAIDGLDDEWRGNVAIEIEVNGVAIYTGPSPWPSWDGVGHGEQANWTTVSMRIPIGMLHAGANQITVLNTEPVANFGTGPYVLVSGAKILPGAP